MNLTSLKTGRAFTFRVKETEADDVLAFLNAQSVVSVVFISKGRAFFAVMMNQKRWPKIRKTLRYRGIIVERVSKFIN